MSLDKVPDSAAFQSKELAPRSITCRGAFDPDQNDGNRQPRRQNATSS